MKIRTILISSAATLALSAGTTAQAGGYYLSIFGGLSTQDESLSGVMGGTYQDSHFEYKYTFPSSISKKYSETRTVFTTFAYQAGFDVDYENGWVLGAAIGRDLANGVRGELEVAFRNFDIEDIDKADASLYYRFASYFHDEINPNYSHTGTVTGTVDPEFDGDVTAWSFMANLWYDFDLGETPLRPFVGGGLGAANVAVDVTGRAAGSFVTSGSYSRAIYASVSSRLDDSSWVFAYQFGGGLAYDVGNGVTLSAQYRYFGTSEADIDGVNQRVGGHNFLLGLTFPLN